MDLKDLLSEWIDDNVIDKSPSTRAWYRAMAKHLEPLGNMDIHELTKRDVNPILRSLSDSGRPSVARGVQRTLGAALRSEGIILPGVRRPRVKRSTGRYGVWTATQAGVFLAATADDRMAAAWALALVGGMRRGELAGLMWHSIDFEEAVVHVREQRTTVNGKVHHGEPKGTSARTLPLGPMLLDMLRARRAAYEQEAHVAYRRWKGTEAGGGYVFGHQNGLPYYPGWFTKTFPQRCRDVGVPAIALHDARHTSATVGAAGGVDIKTMQARLGHSDPTILTRIYLHLVDEQARAAAGTMERVMRMRRRGGEDERGGGDRVAA